MNNNRNNNNNRRRGRGNNRGGGNPNQANRIDSRARGNAPQMLDKYRKLAQEAQLNDDRVQTEYYLQFADHYFRVMADMKAVKDEQRPRRDGDRDADGSDYDDEDGEEGYARQDERGERNERQRDRDRDRDRDDNRRDARPRGNESRRSEDPLLVPGSEGESGDQSDDDNPFTRDVPKTRQRKPREDRAAAERPARRPRRSAESEDAAEDSGFDPDVLPPSIARTLATDDGEAAEVEAEAPKPRRRLPPRRNRDQGNADGSGDEGAGDGALEAVG